MHSTATHGIGSRARRAVAMMGVLLAAVSITAIVATRLAVASEPDREDEFETDAEILDAQAAEKLARWAELARPGPEHERLAGLAGRWTVRTEYWTHPVAEPIPSTAVVTAEPIFGGRFLLEKHAPDGPGPAEFSGLTIRGYDNQKAKHTLVWLDTMGTHMIVAEGDADETGDTITYFATYTDPMDAKEKRLKLVHERRGDDAFAVTLYEDLAHDLWFKHVHSVATRR